MRGTAYFSKVHYSPRLDGQGGRCLTSSCEVEHYEAREMGKSKHVTILKMSSTPPKLQMGFVYMGYTLPT